MLDEEELIGRREEAVDLPQVEESIVPAGRAEVECRGHVRERDIDFALRERRKRPLRDERQRARSRQASLQRLSPGQFRRHRFFHECMLDVDRDRVKPTQQA